MASDAKNRFGRAIQSEGEATRGSTREVRQFDPTEYARRAARAQFETFREDLGEDFETLRGRQVGTGRLRSGFGHQTQDRFLRDRLDRLDRALATRAQTAGGQKLQQLGLQSRNRGRYFDLLSGQLDRETAESNAKRGFWGNLLTGGMTVAGALVGGPPGAAAGAAAGRAAT